MYTIRFETLGCRLNQIESESAANNFKSQGFNVFMEGVSSKSEEDPFTYFCVINTCAVTQKAEQKARRIIRLLLKKYTNSIILVTGCYAQLAAAEIQSMDSRIVVLGGQLKSRLTEIPVLLKQYLQNSEWNYLDFANRLKLQIVNKLPVKNGFPENSFELSTTSFLSHSRASLKIQDGCNNNCSYCAIHIARGHSVSIDAQIAIDRVKALEETGHAEVVLTTVNIGQYKGRYGDEYINFSQLLKLLLENTKTIHFRISSLYPEIIDDEFCEIIKNERVCPHFHISVQSGSNKILKLMNRNYTAEEVVAACKKLRLYKNNPYIACDIITGFPGETEDDFNKTMELANNCDFAWIHAFPYSERPGTAAAVMKNKVPQSISGERAKKLTDWAIKNKIEYITSYKNIELNAVLETLKKKPAKGQNYVYHAVTDNFLHCEIETPFEKEACKNIKILIKEPLVERIIKGGEIEAKADFVD